MSEKMPATNKPLEINSIEPEIREQELSVDIPALIIERQQKHQEQMEKLQGTMNELQAIMRDILERMDKLKEQAETEDNAIEWVRAAEQRLKESDESENDTREVAEQELMDAKEEFYKVFGINLDKQANESGLDNDTDEEQVENGVISDNSEEPAIDQETVEPAIDARGVVVDKDKLTEEEQRAYSERELNDSVDRNITEEEKNRKNKRIALGSFLRDQWNKRNDRAVERKKRKDPVMWMAMQLGVSAVTSGILQSEKIDADRAFSEYDDKETKAIKSFIEKNKDSMHYTIETKIDILKEQPQEKMIKREQGNWVDELVSYGLDPQEVAMALRKKEKSSSPLEREWAKKLSANSENSPADSMPAGVLQSIVKTVKSK